MFKNPRFLLSKIVTDNYIKSKLKGKNPPNEITALSFLIAFGTEGITPIT